VGTVIGAAGGTVNGPEGSSVVIPAGALASDTRINIEKTSAGAPELPDGFPVSGDVFALTPHGTTFAVPVTITVPFDPALIPADGRPALYKTDSRNLWTPISDVTVQGNNVSAQVTSFSYTRSGIERRAPQREWTFIMGDFREPIHHNDYDRPPWQEVADGISFGPEVFDLDVEDDDKEITLEVFSSANGVTFWASAEDRGWADLGQTQGFIKRANDAKLEFVITEGILRAVDFNPVPTSDECKGVDLDKCHLFWASIQFAAKAFDSNSKSLRNKEGKLILDIWDSATLTGFTGRWNFEVEPTSQSMVAWTEGDFDVTYDLSGNPDIRLKRDIHINVDVSNIPLHSRFYVQSTLFAGAMNGRNRESAIAAYLRDPARTGGTVMNLSGLELTDDSVPAPPFLVVTPPLPCDSGSDPEAGVLQFDAPAYRVVENQIIESVTRITRTQGSRGDVSVTFTDAAGTGVPGVHYTPRSTTVTFPDGDTQPRVVPIEIYENDIAEADRTVMQTLSDPGGCAVLGENTSATLTIIDDDRPPVTPDRFTVGGTVVGLRTPSGGNLVLENHTGLFLEITAPGPFTFSQLPSPVGTNYFVRVFNQPRNAQGIQEQNCTVSNGSGVFGNANVTDVVVNCVDLP